MQTVKEKRPVTALTKLVFRNEPALHWRFKAICVKLKKAFGEAALEAITEWTERQERRKP